MGVQEARFFDEIDVINVALGIKLDGPSSLVERRIVSLEYNLI